MHHEDHAIRVPAVIAQHSSKRVLTSEFAEGLTLEEAREQPESVRRSYAETLWRFVFRGNFVGQAFNADPHPGNYVFQRNGHVTFLDFGCVQPLEDRLYTCSLAQYESALRGDEASFRQATATLYRTDQAPLHDHIRECFEPVFAPGHFHITREYAIDREIATARGIRRFGFHGTSHAFVAERAASRSPAVPLPPKVEWT